ncbi:MAG: nitrate/trimethylamine N-oxide reductase NapE/TorE [Mannheimia varigena]|nr:nitrate/trimethylamine N-oxide reductase NapE/TorE [Mannheimia varigena]
MGSELLKTLLLSGFVLPLLMAFFVGAYGFIVWMLQLFVIGLLTG